MLEGSHLPGVMPKNQSRLWLRRCHRRQLPHTGVSARLEPLAFPYQHEPRVRTCPKSLHRLLTNIDGHRPLSTPQRPLSLRGGNRSSCPLTVIQHSKEAAAATGCMGGAQASTRIARRIGRQDRRQPPLCPVLGHCASRSTAAIILPAAAPFSTFPAARARRSSQPERRSSSPSNAVLRSDHHPPETFTRTSGNDRSGATPSWR